MVKFGSCSKSNLLNISCSCCYPSHEANSNATAKILFHEVSKYKFIMFTHILLDIFPIFNKIVKGFSE